MALHLVLAHLGRDSRLFHGEHAAEATALVGALRLHDLNAIHQLQQVLDLVELVHVLLAGRTQSQFAHAMTGVVEAHLVREGAQALVHLHHIVQELHHVHDLPGGDALMLPLQQARVVDLDKSRTTDGGSHDIVEILEFLFEFLGQGNGLLLESRIGHRLSAARLVQGVFDIKPQMVQ